MPKKMKVRYEVGKALDRVIHMYDKESAFTWLMDSEHRERVLPNEFDILRKVGKNEGWIKLAMLLSGDYEYTTNPDDLTFELYDHFKRQGALGGHVVDSIEKILKWYGIEVEGINA